MPADIPRLISRSCTTGWFDWVWGDLWLTADCLFRISRGMTETREAARQRKRRGGGSTVASDVDGARGALATDLQQSVAADKNNRCIVLREIRTARLRHGVLNSRLGVELNDGKRMKLLCLKSDPAFEILRAVLGKRLGSNLTMR